MSVKINMPGEVKYIIEKLNKKGFEAYIVGGCVRDSLISKYPSDWDITTSATPTQIKEVFDKTVDTGLQHGTVTVIINDNNYELTTYRLDGDYCDNRRPDNVKFTNSLKEDLSRRDFTINAMAYNDKEGLVDYFNGKQNLNDRIIECVGNPDERFQEDALRMMRAIRFACQLGCAINKDVWMSIVKNRNLINNISSERLRDELCKILNSNNPGFGIDLLRATSLLKIILPEVNNCVYFDQHNPNHHKDVYEHTLLVLDNTPNNLIIRLAALLHDVGKPKTFTLDEKGVGHFYRHHMNSMDMSKEILQRLKFDNKTIDAVSILVKEHMSRYDFLRTSSIKKFINRVGKENLDNLFELQIADIKGSKPPHNFEGVINLKKEVEKILNEKQPLTVKDLEVNGYDLMQLGVKPGVKMGEILNSLLNEVLQDAKLNKKEKLLNIVKCKYL